MARSRVFAVLGRRGLRRITSLQSSSDCLPIPLYLLPPDTVPEFDRSGRHRAVVHTQDPRILHQHNILLDQPSPALLLHLWSMHHRTALPTPLYPGRWFRRARHQQRHSKVRCKACKYSWLHWLPLLTKSWFASITAQKTCGAQRCVPVCTVQVASCAS